MSEILLNIKNLSVSILGRPILKNVDLAVSNGSVVALMGPNGSGKTTLAQVMMGNPGYQIVNRSEIDFAGEDILTMSVDERSRAGIFVAWQSPVTIPGVSVLSYLRVIYEASGKKIEKLTEFRDMILELLIRVGLSEEVIRRNLNEGFSGGEKKRFELLQLLLLKPKLAILDEIDSGLDVDGLRMVSTIIAEMKETAFILITHYKKLLEYVSVDTIVVLSKGSVVASGEGELASEIESNGYAKYN